MRPSMEVGSSHNSPASDGGGAVRRRDLHAFHGDGLFTVVGAELHDELSDGCTRLGSGSVRVVTVDAPNALLRSCSDAWPVCVVGRPTTRAEGEELVRLVEEEDHAVSVVLLFDGSLCSLVDLPREHAAVSLIHWPADGEPVLEALSAALEQSRRAVLVRRERRLLLERFQEVTERQFAVLDLIRSGFASKGIGPALGISKRTVDDHRAALLRRTDAPSMASLVHALDRLEALRVEEQYLLGGRWRPQPEKLEALDRAWLSDRTSTPAGEGKRAVSALPEGVSSDVLLELAASPLQTCVLDRDFRLRAGNELWFGLAGGGAGSVASSWLGRSYLEAISPPLDGWFERRLGDVLEGGEPWTLLYECPAPESVSTLRMTAERRGAEWVLLKHERVFERPHSDVPADDGDAVPSVQSEGDVECSNCRRRLDAAKGRWCPTPDLSDVSEETRWILCPRCLEHFADQGFPEVVREG